jgi:hypothetical protein
MTSSHRVAASGHAYAKRLIEVAAPLIERILLLLHIGTLLKLLLFHPSPSPHAAKQSPRGSSDGRTLSSISSDRAAGRSESSSPSRSAKQSTLWSTDRGRGPAAYLRIRSIKSALLNCPVVTLASIALFLLRALASAWVDVHLAGTAAGSSAAGTFTPTEPSAGDPSSAATITETAPKHSSTPAECFRSDREYGAQHKDCDSGCSPVRNGTRHCPGHRFELLYMAKFTSI